ncbi:hypothetical protein DFA_00704 [Cavenderia fasciculata]|uniref:Secreted protein n=1 Tax=Cavenderia fasciculata TaxID=261658 RepID=F4PTA3_CACFS|nr:uncharacterized protein DFA_00704 [Cavenderia fasciculata]EGG20839.1 hypothetical protein DFA_00704 [Cavenderia fasciculata]|eukprot:XP_004358689.1 hypothetical protein DFA_00704 [Cavenderia fasciculata]
MNNEEGCCAASLTVSSLLLFCTCTAVPKREGGFGWKERERERDGWYGMVIMSNLKTEELYIPIYTDQIEVLFFINIDWWITGTTGMETLQPVLSLSTCCFPIATSLPTKKKDKEKSLIRCFDSFIHSFIHSQQHTTFDYLRQTEKERSRKTIIQQQIIRDR